MLSITSEYSTGTIRTTLSIAPRRSTALAAKAVVVVTVTFATAALAALVSWASTYGLLGAEHRIDLSDGTTQRILLGIPLYLAAVALLAMALGAILRSAAGAIGAVVGLLLIVPPFVSMIPGDLGTTLTTALPQGAGALLMQVAHPDAPLSPWQGYGVLVAWALAATLVAATVLERRDT